MAWDDTDSDDDYDEDLEEDEFNDGMDEDGNIENGPAIVRNPYAGGHMDPFDMPEIGERYMPINEFLDKEKYSCKTIEEKIKMKDLKTTMMFDPENILVEFGSENDRKKKVRGVRGGSSPKAPNK